MARITVEDCIDKVDSPYELVMVAKERAVQLNSGVVPSIDPDNDKNTVISLREIAEEKIKVKDLQDAAIYKLRKHVEQVEDSSDEDIEEGDDFENLYKGEISKSGVPILPSKRARKIPEKIQLDLEKEVSNETSDLVNDLETEADSGEDNLDGNEPESLEDLQEKENLDSEKSEEIIDN